MITLQETLNENVAYVRPIFAIGKTLYEVKSGLDGTLLTVMDNRDIAFATCRQHDITPMNVH